MALISMLIKTRWLHYRYGTKTVEEGKEGNSPLFFLPGDFNLMERFSITLLCFCHTPDMLLPLCFTSGQQL